MNYISQGQTSFSGGGKGRAGLTFCFFHHAFTSQEQTKTIKRSGDGWALFLLAFISYGLLQTPNEHSGPVQPRILSRDNILVILPTRSQYTRRVSFSRSSNRYGSHLKFYFFKQDILGCQG